jgi:hypothetical protein
MNCMAHSCNPNIKNNRQNFLPVYNASNILCATELKWPWTICHRCVPNRYRWGQLHRETKSYLEETVTGRWKRLWLGDGRKGDWGMEETVTGGWKKRWLGAGKFVNIIFILFNSVVVEFTAVNVIRICNKVEPNINISLRYFTLIWGTWERPTRCTFFLILSFTQFIFDMFRTSNCSLSGGVLHKRLTVFHCAS